MFRYNDENNITKFDKIVAYQGILCEKIQEGEYRVNKIFSKPKSIFERPYLLMILNLY